VCLPYPRWGASADHQLRPRAGAGEGAAPPPGRLHTWGSRLVVAARVGWDGHLSATPGSGWPVDPEATLLHLVSRSPKTDWSGQGGPSGKVSRVALPPRSRFPSIGLWRSLVARFVRDEEAAGSNPVSPTCSIQDEWPHDSVAAIERLLGAPGDLPDGRTSIRVCPVCADLNCSAVTARIEVADGIVYWHDLGEQRAYQDGVDPIPSTGPRLSYAFLAEEYKSVLLAELERQRALAVDWDIALAAQRRPSWLERLGILRKNPR
jgi:hypothetical protein